MRRLLLLVAFALAACSESPCQELGERLCRCQPGATNDACEAQVEEQLDDVDLSEGYCERLLDQCSAPPEADFCEWLLTEDGKVACELTPPAPEPPAGT